LLIRKKVVSFFWFLVYSFKTQRKSKNWEY